MAERTLPEKSRALRFTQFGPPSKLALVDVVRPAPRYGEVLVQVQAAGVNPSDVKNVEGRFKQTTLPRTPGRDFAGVVVDGPKLLEGLEVWGTGGDLGFSRDGSHAEFVRVPLDAIRQRPKGLSAEQAAAAGVPFLTAWLMLQKAKLEAGETVLVVGGTGAVGTAATQLARWMGARVLATTRRSEPPAAWRSTVDLALRLPDEPLPASALAATGGRGADVVLNCVGGPTFAASVESAARGGRIVAIASNPPVIGFDLVHFYHRELALFGVDSLKLEAAACGPILDRLNEGFARGALSVPEPAVVPLGEAVAAYTRVAEGSAQKIVLVPGR